MFYQGDLQSGIKLAVQQSKLVVCFVRDDGPESDVWETTYLNDASLIPLLSEKTVLLRLQSGSREAGFLAEIYPLPKAPTLVIISNGQLKEYLTSGISEKDFIDRIHLALGNRSRMQQDLDGGRNQNSGSDSNDEVASSSSALRSFPVEDGQSTRRGSTGADPKNEENATEEGQRAAKAIAKKKGLEKPPQQDPKKVADMKYALMQKKRQQDAKNERARILKRVEDDKAERRARENLRKEQSRVASEPEGLQQSNSTQIGYIDPQIKNPDQAATCAIQVRLFDGATVRSRFLSQDTLGQQVREWVDSQRADGDVPYSFKQVLTPRPNKTISISEEEMSLHSLDLFPSATFVLVPIKEYTLAYEAGAGNYISRGTSMSFAFISSGLSLVSGSLSPFLGANASQGRQAEMEIGHPPSALQAGNVRTIRTDGETPNEHQLYNGNALNYEPRGDTEEKEE